MFKMSIVYTHTCIKDERSGVYENSVALLIPNRQKSNATILVRKLKNHSFSMPDLVLFTKIMGSVYAENWAVLICNFPKVRNLC